MQEAMRLYPPVWVLARNTIEDDVIGGFRVRAGTIVMLPQWVIHRDPRWENPEGFDPERFAPERAAGRHRFAYFPFGGGPRICVGSNFAMMEMTLVLAAIAQRYHLDLLPGHPVAMEPVITLRPKFGIMATLRKRAMSAESAVREAEAIVKGT